MQKKFIKLNNNDNHFSLGNLFRVIREISINKKAALQSELFCTIFDVCDVNETTVNNYCVGCRSISDEYKQIILSKEIKYVKDKKVFIPIVMNLLTIMEGKLISVNNELNYINESDKINVLVNKMHNIAKNDKSVKEDFINEINNLLSLKDYYNVLVKQIIYVILNKKQPIYEEDIKKEIIESYISDTSISSNDLNEYLSVKLSEGINYYYKMKSLADRNNAYACYDLGIDECNGNIMGFSRYDVAYNYLIKAANQNHAGSLYALGYLLTEGLIGSKSKKDLEDGYNYLIKSKDLGNIYSYNSLGNMYLNGIYPTHKNVNKAKELYEIAASYEVPFAYNNLGKILESSNQEEAYNYFLKSANLGESWACNKVGEYYRLKGEYDKAFYYYNKGLDCNHRTLYLYNYYNLAKYFYLNGCNTVMLVSNRELAIKYFVLSDSLIESLIELFYIYVEDYLKDKNDLNYKKIIDIKEKLENHDKFDSKIKEEITKELTKIKDRIEIDLDGIV